MIKRIVLHKIKFFPSLTGFDIWNRCLLMIHIICILLWAQDFKALYISDTHISNDSSKVRRLRWLVEKMNSEEWPQVEVLLHGGDVVASVYDAHPYQFPQKARDRLAVAMAIFNRLKITFYLAMGNHDYKIWHDRDSDADFSLEEIEQMETIWKEHTGLSPYYAALHKGWNFIVLNSMRGRYLHRHFDDEQMQFFEKELQKGWPTIVISHFPLKTDHFRLWCWPRDLIVPQNEPRFYQLLEEFKAQIKGIFVGHGHMWRQDVVLGEIPVYEVDDFAEAENIPGYLIEFHSDQQTIRVIPEKIKMDETSGERVSQ